jgi:hypothetical protein
MSSPARHSFAFKSLAILSAIFFLGVLTANITAILAISRQMYPS